MAVDTPPANEETAEYYELVSSVYDIRNALDQLLFYLKQAEPIRWQGAAGKVWDVDDAVKAMVKKAWEYDRLVI